MTWNSSLYNVKIIGWDDGTFYPLHIIAIISTLCSFIASVVVTVTSFKTNTKKFFSWPRSERFVVYMAICEMTFNFVHIFDHVTMVITEDNVHPLELCQFYAFVNILLLAIKNFIVVTIALNAFLLMRFRHQMDFGTKDWRLFAVALGLTVVISILGWSNPQQYGPTGAFCLIKPKLIILLTASVPAFLILSANTTLYLLTWFHIRREVRGIRSILGTQAQSSTAYIEAAKTMTLFVTVFTVQWWAVSVYGIWQFLTDDVPSSVYIFVVFFINIGGCLNLIVFLSILKKRRGTLAIGSRLTTSRSRDQNSHDVKTTGEKRVQPPFARNDYSSHTEQTLV